MTYFEKEAIVSGIGISRIGRRTGIPGRDLTMEAVRGAIADAGLAPADIDGIATLGDTPAEEVNTELGIEAADCGSGFGTGGLLSPVMSACRAVSERRARHVVVYRTIQMLGGTVPVKQEENAPAPRWRGCSKHPRANRSRLSVRWTMSTIWLRPKLIRQRTGWH